MSLAQAGSLELRFGPRKDEFCCDEEKEHAHR